LKEKNEKGGYRYEDLLEESSNKSEEAFIEVYEVLT
jgi:hypothetical protein